MQRGAQRNIFLDAVHAIVYRHSPTTHILDNNVKRALRDCAVVSAKLPVWCWPVGSTVHSTFPWCEMRVLKLSILSKQSLHAFSYRSSSRHQVAIKSTFHSKTNSQQFFFELRIENNYFSSLMHAVHDINHDNDLIFHDSPRLIPSQRFRMVPRL